jgi:light-regulated signal transduction histidine kinase (bacteriophytochrome)/CheY-like chemotaxis protein
MSAKPFQVDLTNCDREPIHIPGSIQPHGAMLVAEGEDGVIRFASENAAAILGADPKYIIGCPLEEVIGQKPAHSVRNAVAKSISPNAPGLVFALRVDGRPDTPFDVAAHAYNDRTFLEFQPTGDDADSYGPLEITRALVRRLADETTIQGIAEQAAKLVRLMLGYDRVMIYKMLHNGAGRVIAEQKRSDLGGFLGQHFPASDIPYQARELYKRNWIRMISDVRYTPQVLLPMLQDGQPPIDMSYAQLRSVSPIHCEYLQNMGVGASMSISILVEGELWGLIACHHYSPKVVPLPQRVGAELFGQYFSLQVEALERRAKFLASNSARERLDRIVSELPPEEELLESLGPRIGELAKLVPCDGAGVWIDGHWIGGGATPPTDDIPKLCELLDGACAGDIWGTHQLSALMPEAAPWISVAAGVLAVPLSRLPKDYLLFFRSEESRSVEWAGDPEKPIETGPLGDRLTPRKSFELWRQEVRGQSTPWTDADLAIADAAQNYLRDVVLRHTEATAEERKRADVRRKLVNEELNHRVKNILALVKSIVEQSRPGAASLEDYSSAVVGRINALSFAHDQITREGGGGDLKRLIESEVAAYGGVSGGGRTAVIGDPIRLTARAYSSMALIAHELATNAAKYGSLSGEWGQVRVEWTRRANGDLDITWLERGGQPVTAPARRGFGSTLITQVIPFDLGGEASIEYPPEGVTAKFMIPARHIRKPQEDVPAAEPDIADRKAAEVDLSGLRVLIVEDQVLIALDAEHSLRRLGAGEVRIAPTRDRALREIEAKIPDLAVLDVNLGDDGTSSPVAEKLRELGVPFVFATGYGDTAMIPESMKTTPIVRKPYGEQSLAAGLAAALKPKRGDGQGD